VSDGRGPPNGSTAKCKQDAAIHESANADEDERDMRGLGFSDHHSWFDSTRLITQYIVVDGTDR